MTARRSYAAHEILRHLDQLGNDEFADSRFILLLHRGQLAGGEKVDHQLRFAAPYLDNEIDSPCLENGTVWLLQDSFSQIGFGVCQYLLLQREIRNAGGVRCSAGFPIQR